MNKISEIIKILEDAVYTHTKQIDRCKTALRKHHREKSLAVLHKSFTDLANSSKKLEKILSLINTSLTSRNSISIEEAETLAVVIFYIYEISIEEERALWSKYIDVFSEDQRSEINSHFTRLDYLKKITKNMLDSLGKDFE